MAEGRTVIPAYYVAVLSHLTPGQKIAQACHAAFAHGVAEGDEPSSAHGGVDRCVFAFDNRVVVVEATAGELDDLFERAGFEGVGATRYRETSRAGDDLGFTACCFGPVPDRTARRMFRGLRLCLSDPR